MSDEPIHRLRELCLSLPGVTERRNHGEPAWVVGRKALVTFSERHPAGRVGFWCPAPPGEREAMVATDPARFFEPPFGGPGWVGVYLDVPVDWTEIGEIIAEAYRLIAPRRLLEHVPWLLDRDSRAKTAPDDTTSLYPDFDLRPEQPFTDQDPRDKP